MSQPADPTVDPSGIHTHLTILQGIISRMASNSQSCKTWCITIVAAVFILAVNISSDGIALIALLPILLLGGLDVYYLGLERAFRRSYEDFVAAHHRGDDLGATLYVLAPTKSQFSSFAACLRSPSIWPFYSVLLSFTILVTLILLFVDH